VIFALGNDGARLLKNHFGDDPACPCWIADDFDFDQATKAGKPGHACRLIAYLSGVPDSEGERTTPRPPLPEWADKWGEGLGWPKKLRRPGKNEKD
jgi:hypothetical protein